MLVVGALDPDMQYTVLAEIASSSPPSWVTYTTLAIACTGLIAALGSLTLSYIGYRDSGYRIVVSAPGLLVGSRGALSIFNEGRGPVDVNTLRVMVVGSRSGRARP